MLFIRNVGPIGYPGSAEVVNMQPPDALISKGVQQLPTAGDGRQSGTCDKVREQLSKATYSDVVMAPAADMFESGVKLQVLKKGTMFPSRAAKLYELFLQYPSLDALPADVRSRLEKQVFPWAVPRPQQALQQPRQPRAPGGARRSQRL